MLIDNNIFWFVLPLVIINFSHFFGKGESRERRCDNIYDLIEETLRYNASDLHISVGIPPTCRINGHLRPLPYDRLKPSDTEKYVKQLVNENQWIHL